MLHYRPNTSGFGFKELLGIVGIIALLLALLATIVTPKLHSGPGIDHYHTHDIMADLQGISTDKVRQKRLLDMPEVRGYQFYKLALKNGVLSPETRDKLVYTRSATDQTSETSFFGRYKTGLLPENCSYTAPKSTDLLDMLTGPYYGKHRKVLFCFNTRNWDSASSGVLLCMSDGRVAESFDYDLWNDKYPDMFTQEEWDDGSNGTIIGKQTPFDMTFD